MHQVLLVSVTCIFLTMTGVLCRDDDILTAHAFGKSLAKCLGEPIILQCFQREAVNDLDILLRDNSTWKYSGFIEFEKDPNFAVSNGTGRFDDESIGDIIGGKLLQLVQARSIRMKMDPKVLEVNKAENLGFGEGGEISRKKQKIWYLTDSLKGRKKKDKNKGMAMMGSLAMIAMMGQMFLGKVLLIAGAAFVMSKIALLISVLTSLKSKASGHGSTDHVVTIDSGHGHGGGGHSGWHRSLPYITPSPPIQTHEEEHHESPHGSEYYSHDTAFEKNDYKFI